MKLISFVVVLVYLNQSFAQDLGKFFTEYGVNGSFVMYDLSSNKYTYYDSARCSKQFTPASTFKIPNSIIGLETGVIKDENHIIPWDNVVRKIEAWNQDMDMKTAIKVSCVPYYQELARRVGAARMQEMVRLLNYGNKVISGGIDEFWLTGSLRISQVEQIDFLRRLCGSELPVSQRSMEITKKIMLLEENAEFTLRGKTGWGDQDETSIGWFVGWVEKNGSVYFFAANIETNNPGDNFASARKEITIKLLKELGVI